METTFYLYSVTLPNGKRYIGQTRVGVDTRFKQHVRVMARRDLPHPFYDALRKYGADAARVDVLETVGSQFDADLRETELIGQAREEGVSLNISDGGDGDVSAAHAALVALRSDPEWDARYRAALREGCLSSPAHQKWTREGLQLRWAEWAGSSPRDVYRMAYRASRIAARGKAKRDPRFSDCGRLRIRSTEVLAKRRSLWMKGNKTWHTLPEEAKEGIHARIAEGVRKHHAAKSPEAKTTHAAQLAEARKNIDHSKRKANQKRALKAYWTPERKAAKAKAMKEHWARKKAENQNENV